MTVEQYLTAGYYIGLCVWLVSFIYVIISAKELAHDNGQKVHVSYTDLNDIINIFWLAKNSESTKIRLSARIHLLIITCLLLMLFVW